MQELGPPLKEIMSGLASGMEWNWTQTDYPPNQEETRPLTRKWSVQISQSTLLLHFDDERTVILRATGIYNSAIYDLYSVEKAPFSRLLFTNPFQETSL